MKAASTGAAPAALLFNWEAPRRRYLAIAGFLAVSLFAHAFCFYLFQIVYPPTVSLLPAPARVSLISLSSEEGRGLLQWIEAEDPALATTTRRLPEAKNYGLPKIEHIPSYTNYEPALKPAPPLVVDLSIPSAHPPGSVPNTEPRRATRLPITPTSVSFSEELQKLGTPIFPAAKFFQSGSDQPSAIRFRVAVSNGVVRYCFPTNSSGDPSLDGQAREHLMLCRFPASTNDSMTWGTATIQWSNDVEHVARPSSSKAATAAESTSSPAP